MTPLGRIWLDCDGASVIRADANGTADKALQELLQQLHLREIEPVFGMRLNGLGRRRNLDERSPALIGQVGVRFSRAAACLQQAPPW